MSMRIDARGLDGMIQALRDVQHENVLRAQDALDQALDGAAEWSYAAAHVHEGDLRASQSHSSTYGRADWTGQVSYSGRGAAFEIQRGGEHAEFIDGIAPATEAAFERGMDAAFRDL